jgi:hypothetical protein
MTMNGGKNPATFTAQLQQDAAPIVLGSSSPASQPSTGTTPPAQTAAALNTNPPKTVFDIDLDGSAIHRQSGLVCPATAKGWVRNSTILYDKAGFDVSCGYRSPAGSEITIFLSRRAASVLNQTFEGAKQAIPKAIPGTNPREGTAAAPRGFDWLKAGFERQEGEIWSDLFLTQFSDWEYEARITYKPADLSEVNAVFAELSDRVARTAVKQLAACDAAPKPQRGGKRITDADEIRSYSVSAAAQARDVIAASRSAGTWCAEGATSGGSTTSDYWRNAAVDSKAPALDRLLGIDTDTHVVIASNAAATSLSAKNGTPHQVYDMLMERKEDVILVAEFDGRPAPTDILQVLASSRIGIYASVNKATANITIFKPS